MKKKFYIVENSDFDGYNQRYHYIGTKKDLLIWLKDGSLVEGDYVGKLEFLFKVKGNKQILKLESIKP